MLERVNHGLLVGTFFESAKDLLLSPLMGTLIRIYDGNELIEGAIFSKRPLRFYLFATRWTLFLDRQRLCNARRAKTVETFLYATCTRTRQNVGIAHLHRRTFTQTHAHVRLHSPGVLMQM